MILSKISLRFALIGLLMATMLLFVGCSESTDEDAVKDNTYWTLVQVEEIQMPGAVWPLAHEQAIVGANNEHVYLTNDGGLSWSVVTINPSTGRMASDIYFAGTRGIMIGLRGMLYTTTNNGQSWTNAFPTGVPAGDLTRIIAPATGGNNPLYICGDEGILLKSIDGGANWQYIDLQIGKFFEDFPIIDSETGETLRTVDTTLYVTQEKLSFTSGWAPNSNLIYLLADTLQTDSEFYILRSASGGAPGTWDMLVMNTPVKWFDIYTFNDTSGIMITNGEVDYVTIRDTMVSRSLNEYIPGGAALKKMVFTNSDIGWIIGAGGTVTKSTNSGHDWRKIDVDVTGIINDISFLNTNEGWLVGNDVSRNSGAIKLTTDGGATWNFRSYGIGGVNLNAVHFISSQQGWITGKSGRIARTTDGGNTWLHQDANTSRSLQDVYFTNANTGWAVGFSASSDVDTFATILHTSNGGITWNSVDSLFGYRLNNVKALNPTTAIAVGNNGLILKSTDWSVPKNSGVAFELFGLDVVDANLIFACGQGGTILKSTDGGETWNQLNSGTNQSLLSIDMVDANVGYACGNLGTVLKTTNGGVNWTLLELPRHSSSVYKSVAFSDSQTGWIIGFFGYILHTADGGETWYRQLEGFSEETLNDVFILDSNNAWIVGNGGILLELGRN